MLETYFVHMRAELDPYACRLTWRMQRYSTLADGVGCFVAPFPLFCIYCACPMPTHSNSRTRLIVIELTGHPPCRRETSRSDACFRP